jgi:hypothetical protein
VQAYANVSLIQAIYNLAESMAAGIRTSLGAGGAGGERPVIPFTPTPSTIESIANAIIRAVELFTVGKPEVTQQIAEQVARKLIELSQGGGQGGGGGGSSQA